MYINSTYFNCHNQNNFSKQISFQKKRPPKLQEAYTRLSNPNKEDEVNLDWIDDSHVQDIIKRIMHNNKPQLNVKDFTDVLKYFGYENTKINHNGHGTIYRPIAYKKGIFYTVQLAAKEMDPAAISVLKAALQIVNYTNGELINPPKNKQTLTPEEVVAFKEMTKEYYPEGNNRYRSHLEEYKTKKEEKEKQEKNEIEKQENIQNFGIIINQQIELTNIEQMVNSVNENFNNLKLDFENNIEFSESEYPQINDKQQEIKETIKEAGILIAEIKKDFSTLNNAGYKMLSSCDLDNLKTKLDTAKNQLDILSGLIDEVETMLLEALETQENESGLDEIRDKIKNKIEEIELKLEFYENIQTAGDSIYYSEEFELFLEKYEKEILDLKTQFEETYFSENHTEDKKYFNKSYYFKTIYKRLSDIDKQFDTTVQKFNSQERQRKDGKYNFASKLASKMLPLPPKAAQEALCKIVLKEIDKTDIEKYINAPSASLIFINKIISNLEQKEEIKNIKQALRFAFFSYIDENLATDNNDIFTLNPKDSKNLYDKLSAGKTTVKFPVGEEFHQVNLNKPMDEKEINKQFIKYYKKMQNNENFEEVLKELLKYSSINLEEDMEKVKTYLKKQGSYFELLSKSSINSELKKILLGLFWENYDKENGTNNVQDVLENYKHELELQKLMQQQAEKLELFKSINWEV